LDEARPPRGSTNGPATLTVGGFSGRTVVVLLVIALVGIVAAGGVAWAANVEPIRVDSSAIAIRPPTIVERSVDATSPRGVSFTQYTLGIATGDEFGFMFYLHNAAPYPVTVTKAGQADPQNWAAPQVRLGRSGTEMPTETVPYTIPAHEYAAIQVMYRFEDCLPEDTTLTVGTLPLRFKVFGFVSRSTTVTMPMTIVLTGPPGTTCPATG
jgi:hypothetical protein